MLYMGSNNIIESVNNVINSDVHYVWNGEKPINLVDVRLQVLSPRVVDDHNNTI